MRYHHTMHERQYPEASVLLGIEISLRYVASDRVGDPLQSRGGVQ